MVVVLAKTHPHFRLLELPRITSLDYMQNAATCGNADENDGSGYRFLESLLGSCNVHCLEARRNSSMTSSGPRTCRKEPSLVRKFLPKSSHTEHLV
jgi:hypothetical protein